MKRIVIFLCFLVVVVTSIFSQSNIQATNVTNQQPAPNTTVDSTKIKAELLAKKHQRHKKFIQAADTLSKSDYLMSIDRVNDNIIDIRDSAKLGFEVVKIGHKIDEISKNLNQLRQNFKNRRAIINIRNLYLYQSFASDLDEENDQLMDRLNRLHKRVSHSKLRIKTVLKDSIFKKLYADSLLRNAFENKLVRLERKWEKTDSITKQNIDSLNALKVKVADNSISLTNMLSAIDDRLDKADQRIFSQELNCLWQTDKAGTLLNDTTRKTTSVLSNEQKAIGYYFSHTSQQRILVLLLGFLLFIWLFLKRKLLKIIREQKNLYDYLNLRYINSYPILSLVVLLLCIMPFLDAYAPTSYIAIEYILLLTAVSIIFFKKTDRTFLFNWLALVVLFVLNVLTYLFTEPTFITRLWMVAIHTAIIIAIYLFSRKLSKRTPYYKWIRISAIVGIILTSLAIISNLFGRFSLACIFGIAGVFAVTHAVVLTVFIQTIIEIILLQLISSRQKKGINKPFDSSTVINKIKMPILIVAVVLWCIMLTSNMNIYHGISNALFDVLTSTRSIGSISFKLTSVFMFIAIIWLAHILQRLISFLFGETGTDSEDLTTVTKGQHSRLLITRLLVLIGGYLLAIAASGLPIDKLTFLLGALGVGIGMGLQNVVNNFVSGIILIFDGSLQIGDEIEVTGQTGKVKEIGLRASTLSTADGAEVIIPNGNILSQNIVNWTFSNDQKRITLAFSLSGKELDANVINEVINETIKSIPNVISHKKPVILYTKVTPESCSLTIRFWSTISKVDLVKSEVLLELSTAFTDKNIGFE